MIAGAADKRANRRRDKCPSGRTGRRPSERKERRKLSLPLLGLLFAGVLSIWLLFASERDSSAPQPPQGTPVFAVLKADKVNVRRGPSFDHGVQWVYKRRGVPVEILERHEHWRRIGDMDGASGWVHFSLLDASERGVMVRRDMRQDVRRDTGRNSAGGSDDGSDDADGLADNLVENDGLLPLRARAGTDAPVLALLQPGVVLEALECRPHWCRVGIGNRRGWVERASLWGVAPQELF